MRDADVAEFGMSETVEELAAGHAAAADAGADRDVAERVDVLGGSPAVLAESGGVDVRVESDRDRQSSPDLGADDCMGPTWFGRRRDLPPRRRRHVPVHRTERADTDCIDRPRTLEELDRTVDRFGRRRGRNRFRRPNVVRSCADCESPFRAAGFDAAEDAQTAAASRAPHDLRMMKSGGRTITRRRIEPRPAMRSTSS